MSRSASRIIIKDARCIYCEGDSNVPLYATSDLNGQSYIICHCNQCGFGFLSPRPTPEDLGRAYDESYYGKSESKFGPVIETVLDFFRRGRSRRVQKYIPNTGTILDIGCGNGRFLGYLLEKGYNAYGIERAGKSAERAAGIEKLHLSTEPLCKNSYPSHFFDAISLWHVFEHLTNPKATLEMINYFLKPGGYLFLSLPNIESFQSRIFKGKWLHLDPPKHLLFPGPQSLIRELERYGFELVEKTFFSIEQNPFGIQQSLLNCICKKREILFESLKGNDAYIADTSKTIISLQKFFYLSTFWLFIIVALLESLAGKGGTMEMVFRKIN